MKIIVNHSEIDLAPGSTVAEALTHCGLDGAGIAVALEGAVVPRAAWPDTVLTEGAHLTVITAVCGG